jgi:hypothetical protein
MADGILGVVPTIIGAGVTFRLLDVAFPKGKSKSGGSKMKGKLTRGTLKMPKANFGNRTFTKPKFNVHATLKGKKVKVKSILASAGV